MARVRWWGIGIFLVGFFAGCADGDGSEEPPNGDEAENWTLDISTPAPMVPPNARDQVFEATLTGGDIDAAEVTWKVSDGYLWESEGPTVQWDAPDSIQDVEIEAVARNANNQARAKETIKVRHWDGSGPQVRIVPEKDTVGYDGTIDIRAEVRALNPAVEEDAEFAWEVDDGELSSTEGQEVQWTAPLIEGSTQIRLEMTFEGESFQVDTELHAQLCDSGDVEDPDDPCMLSNIEQVQRIRPSIHGNFALAQDIDASDTSNWNDGKGFNPRSGFRGTFHGNGHTIDGLYIRRDDNEIGLFGSIEDGAVIRDVHLRNADVGCEERCGMLVGFAEDGRVRDASAQGYVTGINEVGGLVGMSRTVVENSWVQDSVIEQVTPDHYDQNDPAGLAGGVVGWMYGGDARLEQSYSLNNEVSGRRYIGGLVGGSGAPIVRSYSLGGSVTAQASSGGLAGRLPKVNGMYVGEMIECFAATELISADGETPLPPHLGGLVGDGHEDAEVIRSYWDHEVAGTKESIFGGFWRSTEQMLRAHTYTDWNFDPRERQWLIDEENDYPTLFANRR